MRKSEFEKILVEAIDDSFSSLGESPKQAIFFHLDNTFKIKAQEIPNKLDSFDHAIKKLFGAGADFLEALIVKKLVYFLMGFHRKKRASQKLSPQLSKLW